MRRRKFFQAVAATSAATPIVTAQTPSNEPVKLATVPAAAAAEPARRFFSDRQFATLRTLGEILMPAHGSNPGATQAQVAPFLDFLLSVSPAPRQQLYRQGLDHLEAEARKLHKKAFADLDAAHASAILKPLVTPWTYEGPAQPLQQFMTAVRADVRTATVNSEEWFQANSGSRRRRGGGGVYWHPIDPRA